MMQHTHTHLLHFIRTPISFIRAFWLRYVFNDDRLAWFGNANHFADPFAVEIFIPLLGNFNQFLISPVVGAVAHCIVATLVYSIRRASLVKLEGIHNGTVEPERGEKRRRVNNIVSSAQHVDLTTPRCDRLT